MSDIAFKVLVGNGYDDVLFKTIMLKGEKGDTGETDIDDSTISASKTWSSQKINSMIAQTETIENVEIASFSDGADDVPVSDLIADITAVQAGSGVPSPDNEREILGFDSGVVSVCGVNLWEENCKNGYYNVSTGDYVYNANQLCCNDFISVKPNTDYYCYKGAYTNQGECLFYDENKAFISYLTPSNFNNKVFTTPNNCRYITFNLGNGYGTTYGNNISINYPSTDTSYHAYNGNNYTFAFGQTVYGGHFDNKGNLVVTHGAIDLGSLTWGDVDGNGLHTSSVISDMITTGYSSDLSKFLCEIFTPKVRYVGWSGMTEGQFGINAGTLRIKWLSIASGIEFKTFVNGKYLVYELATPITLAITAQSVATLLENNNIFANTGNIKKLVYFKKGSEAVARMIEAYMRASN